MRKSFEHMEDRKSGIKNQQLEKAIVLAAVAAVAWCQGNASDEQYGERSLDLLMKAAAWGSRIRRDQGLSPLTLPEIISAFMKPLSQWLPGAEGQALVHEGEPTPICHEYADSAGIYLEQEIEQAVIPQIMSKLIGDVEGAEKKYSRFRKFLVENAYALKKDAAAAVQEVGADLSRIYGPIPVKSQVEFRGKRFFYPCPRCKWPMARQGGKFFCERSTTCMKEGAQFDLSGNKLKPLGQKLPPEPLPCDGYVAILAGLWRFTVLPGLEELKIYNHLCEFPYAEVILWPNIDAYDLEVRVESQSWRVDVKDYVSYVHLINHLIEHPASEETWIVVPDCKEHFVDILKQSVPENANFLFASCRKFLKMVKQAGKE
jgi:hypothetical protein